MILSPILRQVRAIQLLENLKYLLPASLRAPKLVPQIDPNGPCQGSQALQSPKASGTPHEIPPQSSLKLLDCSSGIQVCTKGQQLHAWCHPWAARPGSLPSSLVFCTINIFANVLPKNIKQQSKISVNGFVSPQSETL